MASAERISDERQEVDELKHAREAAAPQLAAMRAEAPCPPMPSMSNRCRVLMAVPPRDQRKDDEAVFRRLPIRTLAPVAVRNVGAAERPGGRGSSGAKWVRSMG